MKRSPLLLFALGAWLFLGAASPTPDMTATSDSKYGVYPIAYKEIITAWLEKQLNYPYALDEKNKPVLDENGQPRKAYEIRWLSEPKPVEMTGPKGEPLSGYFVEFSVNALNKFKGKTGWRKYGVLIRNGEILKGTGFGIGVPNTDS